MPRERIIGALLPFSDEDPRESVVEVSWSGEAGHVQMVTKMVHRSTGEDEINIDLDALTDGVCEVLKQYQVPAMTDGSMRQAIFESLADKLQYAGPQYVQLDRYGANRLVKMVRRARNAAFGADE